MAYIFHGVDLSGDGIFTKCKDKKKRVHNNRNKMIKKSRIKNRPIK